MILLIIMRHDCIRLFSTNNLKSTCDIRHGDTIFKIALVAWVSLCLMGLIATSFHTDEQYFLNFFGQFRS